MKKGEVYDVTIIGGGPIGLFTTFYSGMRDLKTKLIESSSDLGGKITMFYPEKIIRDIGGIPGIKGADLVKQLKEQAFTFEPEIVCNQRISGMRKDERGIFQLISTDGHVHYTKTIILTVGAGIFEPIRLDVPRARDFETANLHYTVEEISHFENKRVLISGGGNTAVDWANELVNVAESLSIIHRRDEFSGHEQHTAKMRKAALTLTPYEIKSLYGETYIESVEIENLQTGKTEIHEVDEVIVNHGIKGDYGGIMEWELEMQEDRISVNHAMETNIPGIFAAGDAVTYPNKLKLIAGGFMEGPLALNSAKRYLKPDAEGMAMYSTHHEKLLETKEEEQQL